MKEINKEKFRLSMKNKINIKMSNMNMKIIVNKYKKNKIIEKNSILLNKSNLRKYTLPSFTKKIFNTLSHS